MKTLGNKETQKVLEEHFANCVRYWQSVGRDERSAYKCTLFWDFGNLSRNPLTMDGEPLDADTVKRFKKYRLQDIYGRDYKSHLGEIEPGYVYEE